VSYLDAPISRILEADAKKLAEAVRQIKPVEQK